MTKLNDVGLDAPPVDATGANAQTATERAVAGDARREALRKIGKFSAYAAPAMLAVANGNAAAASPL